MRTIASTLTAAVLLSACAAPLPVTDKPADFTPPDHLKNLKTLTQVSSMMWQYFGMYEAEAANKFTVQQRASETGFYSSVIGVLGGMFKSADVAIAGGIGGAGAGLYADRYRLSVQAANYLSASGAMRCLFSQTKELDEGETSLAAFFGPTDAGYQSTQKAAALRMATDALMEVRSKLWLAQMKFVLGTPDVNKLKTAMSEKATPAAGAQALAAPTDKEIAAARGAVSQRLKNYEEETAKCIAMFGG